MKDLVLDWDQWNVQKNEEKHGISVLEAESAFYDPRLAIFEDIKQSIKGEQRWIAFGRGGYQNILMIAFTIRKGKIRIISARKASKKERVVYEETP